MYKKIPLTVRTLCFSAACIAVAVLLSLIPPYRMANGGSVTFGSMFFISLAGFWYGPYMGITAGITFGLIDFIIKPEFLHPIQVLFDYLLAYGALGLSGFFRGRRFGMCAGYITGASVRFLLVTLSGCVFWSSYLSYGSTFGLIVASGAYNITYILPEMILTVLVISVPGFRSALAYIERSYIG